VIQARQIEIKQRENFTTDPSSHTGEVCSLHPAFFDKFLIRSPISFSTTQPASDDGFLTCGTNLFPARKLQWDCSFPPNENCKPFFDHFSSGPDDHRFAVRMSPGAGDICDENLLSRSLRKARAGPHRTFDEVLLDCSGIRSSDRHFSDEKFFVSLRMNSPAVKLIAINANEQVTGMIRRAEAARRDRSN